MLARLREVLDSWPLIAALGAVYLVSQIAIGVIVHPLGSDMLAVQTSLSADAVRAIFARWDAAGLTGVYASHYTLDAVHPLWYGALLAALLAKALAANEAPAKWNALLLVPLVAALCDVLENQLHLGFLADRESITPARVLVANGAALVKWALAAGSIAAVAALAWSARQRARSASSS